MTYIIEVFEEYPAKYQEDFLRIYEDQVNPRKPDHSLLELVIELMKESGATLYAIQSNDQWVGAGLVLAEDGERVMRHCCIAPPLRNHGVGAELVSAIANKESEKGLATLYTEIDSEDRQAARFLKQNQFTEVTTNDDTMRLMRPLTD